MESAFGYKIETISQSYAEFLATLASADLVLTPTRRLAARLNQDYAAATDKKVWHLNILSLAGWLSLLWQEHQIDIENPVFMRLNAWQNRLLWQDIIDNSDLTPLLRKAPTAALAEQAWSVLKTWGIHWRMLKDDAQTPDILAFLQWCEQYEARCLESAWCDESSMLSHLMSAKPSLSLNKIYLVGFSDLVPAITSLLQSYAQQGCSIKVLEYRPTATKVSIAPQKDRTAELMQAALWAKAQLQENPSYPIGVIVPDLSTRWSEVDRIFSSVLMPESMIAHHYPKARPYNISAGKKLAEFPVVAMAFEILRINPYAIRMEQLSELLLTPFIAGSQTEALSRAYLDADLRKLGLPQLSRAQIVSQVDENTCTSFIQCLTGHPQPANKEWAPSAWLAYIKAQLEHWGWPGERVLSSLEYQVVRRFYELLSEFAALDFVKSPCTYANARQLLLQQAQAVLFQGESEDKPIQILGHLEAAGLHFHALWVSGLHNENWPAPCAPHPLLPARLQREQNMPHATPEREYLFAADLTQSFTRQAAHVILSYPQQEQDKTLLPSHLIAHYANTPYEPLSISEPLENKPAFEYWDEVNVPIKEIKSYTAGGLGVLQSQVVCPFQAFARYRLHAEGLSCAENGLNAAQRGQLVHAALEFFWQTVGTHAQLLALSEEIYQQHVETSVKKALAELDSASYKAMQLQIENRRLVALLHEWIAHEKLRTPFSVIAREHHITVELSALRLKARIDRIDQLDNGAILLIDYKTGRVDTPQWQDVRPHPIQLPLYAISYPQTTGVVFAQVKANAMKWVGMGDDAHVIGVQQPNDMHWSELLNHWQQTLAQIADEFYQGHAQVAPLEDEKTCRYCDLEILCRIRSD